MAVKNISASFTRPANTTAYASGDLVASTTTAGDVAAMELRGFSVNTQGSCIIRRIKLAKSGTSTTSASFRVHLFRADPATVTNGDNGAFSVSGVADYLGAADVTIDRAFTDGACGIGVPIVGSEFMIRMPGANSVSTGQSIFAMIEARAAYTPASAEVFTLTVDQVDE
jgi:hypothetical protein